MVTPPAFANIGYQTYIIFAVINAFMVPSVYFFYPETAYRSLEEMDEIFQDSATGFKGAFDVVKVAKAKPRRYDKHGELLEEYHQRHGSGVGKEEVEKQEESPGVDERREHV